MVVRHPLCAPETLCVEALDVPFPKHPQRLATPGRPTAMLLALPCHVMHALLS